LQEVFGGATSWKVKQTIAEGDLVVEWHGETPLSTSGLYVNDYCWVIRVTNNKLTEVTGYFDTAAVNALFVQNNTSS